jgi:hypothetical protein
MHYRQFKKITDLDGYIYWELSISDNYAEIFDSNAIDVDVFAFDSIKKSADSADYKQKEDELSVSAEDWRIQTADDQAAINLIKTASTQKIWVAVFEHENSNYISCDFNDKIFIGKFSNKISIDDKRWYGNQWSGEITPIRSYKLTAQSMGVAILDDYSLADENADDGTVKTGILNSLTLNDLNATTAITMLDMPTMINTNSYWSKILFETPIYLNNALKAILTKVENLVKINDIPEFKFRYKPTLSGFDFAVQILWDETKKITTLPSSTDKARLLYFDYSENQYNQPIIDWQLLLNKSAFENTMPTFTKQKYKSEIDDSETIRWTKYGKVSDLLYKIALCFGCVLKFENITATELQISFEPIYGNVGKKIHIYDSESASLDLQSSTVNDSDNYHCRATNYCRDAYDYCEYVRGNKNYSGYILSKDSSTLASEFLPLSIAITTQKLTTQSSDYSYLKYIEYLPQNCSHASNSPSGKKDDDTISDNQFRAEAGVFTPWNGLIFKSEYPCSENIIQHYSFASKVAVTINEKSIWFDSLADALNFRKATAGQIYTNEYKLLLPFIKSVSLNTDGSGASLKNLDLYDEIVLDNHSFIVREIEIKPDEGKIELTLTETSKYGYFAPPILPEGNGKIVPNPKMLQNSFNDNKDENFEAAESIEAGLPVALNSDGKAVKYSNSGTFYGKFLGIALTTNAAGEYVNIRRKGIVTTNSELIVNKAIYLRWNQINSRTEIAQTRLFFKTSFEDIDITIGKAIDSYNYELFCEINEIRCKELNIET